MFRCANRFSVSLAPGALRLPRLLTLLVLLAAAGRASAQTIIYVNAAAAPGGDGTSWQTAYRDLNGAITTAATIDPAQRNVQIWVAAGTYKPVGQGPDPRGAYFELIKGVAILGGFAGGEIRSAQRNVLANPVVLSGDLLGNDIPYVFGEQVDAASRADNVYKVVRTAETADHSAILDGVVVTGAFGETGVGLYAPCILRNCTIISNHTQGIGGGFHAFPALGASPPVVECCRIIGNTAATGGGGGAVWWQRSVVVMNCEFIANRSGQGGGFLARGNAQFYNCTLTNNHDDSGNAGGIANNAGGAGGGPYQGSGHFIFQNGICANNTGSAYEMRNNHADDRMHVQWSLVLNSAFCACGGQVIQGAGMRYSADPLFENPDGPDGLPGTFDDNSVLAQGSPVIDAGDPGVSSTMNDAGQNLRRIGIIDLGAREFGAPYYSPILRVRAESPSGGDGFTWATALRDLQDAIAAAPTFGIKDIWVAAGTYTPSPPLGQGGSRSASFELLNGLAIFGGFAGNETELSQRDIAANETILSGDLNGDDVGDLNRSDNSLHVVSASGVSAAVLDGVTVIGGNADGQDLDRDGGGVLVTNSTLNVRNCTLELCSAARGGGAASRDSQLVLERCSFRRNFAIPTIDPREGGALYVGVGSVTAVDCEFEENTARFGGAVWGGGETNLVRCRFVRNLADAPNDTNAYGGAAYLMGASDVALCEFYGNGVGSSGSISIGDPRQIGALSSNGPVVGCIFVGNYAGPFGNIGALSTPHDVVNCVFVENHAPEGEWGALAVHNNLASVANCVIVNNSDASGNSDLDQVSDNGGAPPMFRHSSIQNWTGSLGGTGNNGLDPRFRRMPSPGADGVWGTPDDDYGDLRLTNGSPAIDSGDSTAVPLDTLDIDGDGNTTESLPLDLDGLARFVDDPLIANTGIGSPPVDRGAYEFVPPIVTAPGDRRWVSPEGGNFSSLFNWFPAVPGALDNAVFDIPGAYTVSFAPLPPTATRTARISRGHPTFDLNGATYSITSASEPALIVGDEPGAAAMLTITDGTVAPFSARIGAEPESAGVIAVSGAGARLSIAQDDLSVGFFGQGHMVVSEGARVVSRTAGVGDQPGSEGSSVVVTGAGSTWSIPFFLAINNGSVTVSDGGTLTAGFGVFLFQNGTISGNGTIDADVVNFGTLAPGNSPGTLTIAGNYEQVGIIPELGANSGRLRMEVSGPAANQHDKLVVTGSATLGGGLFVEFTDGYAPEPDGMGNFPTFRLLESSTPLASRFDVAFFPPVPAVSGQGAKFLRAIYPSRGPGAVDLVIADLGINPEFNDPDMLEILGGPTAAAVGDLNRDGLPDLAITLPDTEDPDNNDGVLIILFNQGLDNDDQWLGFGAATQVNVQKFPSGVAIGDFDGVDGNDVAVVNMRSNSLNIISQQSAAGTFDNALTLPTGLEPTSVAAFNLDRAGRIDLGVTDGGDDTVGMYANSNLPGTPGFTRTTIPVGMRPTAIRPFNPDNDKDVDCAIINNGSAALSVLVNLGFGTFGPAIIIPVGADPVGIIAAPLLDRAEGDNREDLVVVNRDGGSVSVIVNNTPVATTDALSFAPAVESVLNTTNPAGAQPSSLAVVDMDDDGDRDLAVLARATDDSATVVRVLRNDLNGGEQLAFAESAELGAGLGPVAVLSADVDGDGRQDLITVNAQGPRGPGTGSVQTLRSALDPPPTVCAADFDQNGELQVADIFSFLTGWFNNIPSAYNFGGTPGVPAIFAFLAAWFAGC